MEGLFRTWRAHRYHIIWALQRAQPHPLPRDVARHLVRTTWLAWERAYCWLCLRAFRVHVWRGCRGILFLEHDKGRPVCGDQCVAGSSEFCWDPVAHTKAEIAQFLLARDWLILSGLSPPTLRTHQQRAAGLETVVRKKRDNDKARAAIADEARKIERERKAAHYEARKAAARRGKRGGK